MSIFASGGFIWFCCPWCPTKPLQPPCLKRCNPRPSLEPLPSCSWGMWQWHLWWLRSWCAQASVAQIWTKDWSTLHHWIVDVSTISLQENCRCFEQDLVLRSVTIPWCQATPWQSGCARPWRRTPDLKAQHSRWGEIHKVEHDVTWAFMSKTQLSMSYAPTVLR